MSADFSDAAWSWVEHLRRGGRTRWLDWVEACRTGRVAPTGAAAGAPAAGPLPGAAELELVRRLAGRLDGPAGPPFTALADRVLARSGPGRGLAQLPLPWPDGAVTARVGAPPTDPARVPAGELVRVGVGTLADLLLREPAGAARGSRPPWRRPWSRQFRLAGAPVTTASVRAALAASGHVEGGRHPEVLLFVPPFEEHLAQIWSARAQRGEAMRWPGFVGRWAGRDELPPSLRLERTARRWADRVGPDRVHVVAAPRDEPAARRTAAVTLGVRVGDAPVRGTLRELSPAGADLLRRLDRVLEVRLPASGHRAVLARAADLVADAPGTPLVVPEQYRAWASERAGRLVEDLSAGGYAVHGDLQQVALRHRDGLDRPRTRDVLDLVLDACLGLAVQVHGVQEAR